tara:strand:+ start:953 stop:3565 length:2613 start_codon:yes stop_codon:yes gene_type:complete
MKIFNNNPPFLFKNFLKVVKKNKISRGLFFFIFIIFISLTSFIIGVQFDKNKYRPQIKDAIKLNWRIPLNMIRGFFASPNNEIIIDIKHKNLLYLFGVNNYAVKHNYGILNTTNSEYKNAFFTHNNNKKKGELRIKGNWIDSRSNNKLSLRIKLDDGETILGMNRFSIHDPKVKSYISEWLFHELLKYEDIISPRYDFVNININGENKGLFAIEEHFDKRIIENNNRREGLILKLDEVNQVNSYTQLSEDFKRRKIFNYEDSSYSISPIKSYNEIDDKNFLEQLGRATTLFESFRGGQIPANKVFNIEQFAKLFALCDILGASHSLYAKNIKFYFNPVTSMIEPIGYDQHHPNRYLNKMIGQNNKIYNKESKIYWPDQLFTDQYFFKKYIKFLEKFSNPEYLDEFFSLINNNYEKIINLTYKTNYFYALDNKKILFENQQFIKRKLYPKELTQAYLQKKTNGSIILKIGNIYNLPIEIIGIEYKNKLYENDGDRYQDTKVESELIKFKEYVFDIHDINKSNIVKDSLKVVSKVLGTDKIVKDQINLWPFKKIENVKSDLLLKNSNLSEHDFLTVKANKIIFNRNNIVVSKDLIIPEGFTVVINEGTEIDLINSSSIISHSPIIASGSEEYPIKIFSSDSLGQGIAVFNAKNESVFNFVKAMNLSVPKKNGWELTGALTFYQSKININNCVFSKNKKGDDFLNIIRSEFIINNSFFHNILYDAFDSDFSNGTIQNSTFQDIGNDALDFSGSLINTNNIIMDNVYDKGISAGEATDLTIKKITITNSNIGICSKDNSKIFFTDVKLINNKIGFTAFQKKNEFGPGYLEGKSVDMQKTETPFLIEKSSYCKVDNSIIKSNLVNAKELLYKIKL